MRTYVHALVELLVAVSALVIAGGDGGESMSNASEDRDRGDDDGELHDARDCCGLWLLNF